MNIHACMGDSCYCRPGNEHLWQWSEEDKENLRKALDKMFEIEQASKDRDGI